MKDFKIESKFWESVLTAWCELNYKTPETKSEIINQVLWYNSEIKINNRMIYYPELYDRGVSYLKDITAGNKIMKQNEIEYVYGCTIDTMKYNSLIAAIPNKWKKECQNAPETEDEKMIDYLLQFKKWSQIVYSRLITNDECLRKISKMWTNKLNIETDQEEIQESFKGINKITKIVK